MNTSIYNLQEEALTPGEEGLNVREQSLAV